MDLDQVALQTLNRTWDLHQFIYRSVEKNIEIVKAEFEIRPYDPWYFSHRVRYLTCCDLDSADKTTLAFERTPQALSAIDLRYNGCHFKVWKTTDGELPITGTSAHRCEFVSQPYLEHFFDALQGEAVIPMNLVLLWEVDSSLGLSSMQLVCPKNFENFWKSGEAYFSRSVPHPAADIVSTSCFTEEPSELDIELDRKKAANSGKREG
jgi:hypothetical protein